MVEAVARHGYRRDDPARAGRARRRLEDHLLRALREQAGVLPRHLRRDHRPGHRPGRQPPIREDGDFRERLVAGADGRSWTSWSSEPAAAKLAAVESLTLGRRASRTANAARRLRS